MAKVFRSTSMKIEKLQSKKGKGRNMKRRREDRPNLQSQDNNTPKLKERKDTHPIPKPKPRS
jgi:hypothetical protein